MYFSFFLLIFFLTFHAFRQTLAQKTTTSTTSKRTNLSRASATFALETLKASQASGAVALSLSTTFVLYVLPTFTSNEVLSYSKIQQVDLSHFKRPTTSTSESHVPTASPAA